MLQIFQNIAELQTTCRNRGICEVLTEDRDYLKVIAHAMPCIVREDTRVNSPTCVQLLLVLVRNSQIQKTKEHAEENSENTLIT